MSEPALGTVDSDLPHDPDLPAVAAEPSAQGPGGTFTVGQRWRDLVIEAVVQNGAPRTYLANHIGLMEKVVLHAAPITEGTEWRRGAWERLVATPDGGTIRCVEAFEENGWRYEMTAVPPSITMREWIMLHKPGFADVEVFVRQMAAILGGLHAQGVVHLNIRPESIFIDDSRSEPIYLLGGLHDATLYTHPQISTEEVDPFYAPPETAGGAQPRSGTRLCAWDWWSVGRVVQEFLLGKHVLALVLDRDVSRPTPELRHKAELLLREQEPTGVRAGALDYMPEDPATAPLLRGLLTSSAEARWGLDAVQRWLRREPVQDHYDLPRYARLWSWRGRGFTLAEAAEFFTQAENWDAGEDTLFNPQDAETLAHFLADVPTHQADNQRLQAVCDLSESNAWEQVPVVVRRTVTAAMAWMSLAAGSGGKATLRVRGQMVDLSGLAELLHRGGVEAGVPLLMALMAPPVVQFVETFDAPSARTLKAMAAKGGEALRLALEHGWLDPNDTPAHARIIELALQSPAVLRERVELLHAMFATCAQAPLARLLAEKAPSPSQLVVLAYTGETAERFGYITHENWRRQQCAELKAQGDRIVTGLLWQRLRQLLTIGWLWGAPSTVFVTATLVLTVAVAWLSRSLLLATAAAGSLLLSRVWLWWRVRWMLRRFDREAARWNWRDGLERCRTEVARVSGGGRTSAATLRTELHAVRSGIVGFATATAKGPTIAEPFWLDIDAALLAAVAAVVWVLAQVVMHPYAARPREAAIVDVPAKVAAAAAKAGQLASAPTIRPMPLDADALIASGRYEVVDDGFGRRLRGPLRKWEYFAPAAVPVMEIVARAPVSPEQTAFAVVSGTLLLQPYARKGVNAILAVHVPTTRGFGVVLFNARDRVLLERRVLLVRDEPAEGSWYEFEGKRALYLGTPVPLDLEISLAPP